MMHSNRYDARLGGHLVNSMVALQSTLSPVDRSLAQKVAVFETQSLRGDSHGEHNALYCVCYGLDPDVQDVMLDFLTRELVQSKKAGHISECCWVQKVTVYSILAGIKPENRFDFIRKFNCAFQERAEYSWTTIADMMWVLRKHQFNTDILTRARENLREVDFKAAVQQLSDLPLDVHNKFLDAFCEVLPQLNLRQNNIFDVAQRIANQVRNNPRRIPEE